jgi:hypothetical protein
MSAHLAVIYACEPLLFHRIIATLRLDSGPAQTCNHLYIQMYIEGKHVKFKDT